jgi:hypothetical protein
MKKLLFVLAFTFIGGQAFSQIYTATLTNIYQNHPSGCTDQVLTKVDPTGNLTYNCIPHPDCINANSNYIDCDPTPLVEVNKGLNSIINQGYKLISQSQHSYGSNIYIQNYGGAAIWYFAIP